MAFGGLIGGGLSGFADQANKMREKGKRGILRRKKKEPKAEPLEYKKGGRVRKTGMAKVHKGEVVIPAKKRGRRSGKRR